MKIAIAIVTIGLAASSIQAAPIYVGENLKTQNNIGLNFQDTLTKKDVAAGRTDTGNIAAIELRAAYNVNENIPAKLWLPFYMSSKDITGTSRNAMGNVGLGLGWTNSMPTESREMTWGYSLALNTFLPTSREIEGNTVAAANPSIDLYRYLTKTTSVAPVAGLFFIADQFSGKANMGYGYSRNGASGVTTDKNGHSFTGQLATSWHAMPSLHLNAEYNTVYANAAMFGTKKYRHSIAPSVSGNYEAFTGSIYGNIPLDSTTRDLSTVAFGLNVGYTF